MRDESRSQPSGDGFRSETRREELARIGRSLWTLGSKEPRQVVSLAGCEILTVGISPSDADRLIRAHNAGVEFFRERIGTVQEERDDWRLTVWEHLVTDLTSDGTTSAGYGLADVPHDVLRGYVVDASEPRPRIRRLEAALSRIQFGMCGHSTAAEIAREALNG